MKSTIKFFQICLLLCGVFDVDADEVKKVPVTEGDSVTLNSNLTKIQGINLILWTFGDEGSTIAQIDGGKISYPYLTKLFGDRLQLDHQTGSLTIKNMRTNHTGPYKQMIIPNSGSSLAFTFSVTVYESPSVIDAGKAEMKSVSVMEGVSVTLQTDVTEPHGDELIVWRFGDEGKLIAKHDIEAKSSPLHDTDERFRDRLKLDEKTGSLTITNTRTTDSGLYTVKISSSKQMLYKRFSVIISDSGPSIGVIIGIVVPLLLLLLVVVVAAAVIYIRYTRSELEKQIGSIKPVTVEHKEGKSAVLHSNQEIKKGVQMLWRRVYVKDSAIASVSEHDKKTYWYDTRFRGRLQLDPQTGSLTIRNLQKTDAGVYLLEIKSRGGTAYRKYELILTGEVSTVSVKEGDDVTLKFSGKSGDYIKWMFEEKRGFIASLKIKDNRNDNVCEYPDERSLGRFRDRLDLNTQTGSLTIKNIRPEHTGLYRVITDPGNNCKKSFNVVFDDFTETSGNESAITGFMRRIQRFCGLARIDGVFGDEKDEMKTLSVMEGRDLKLNTETKIQPDDEIIVRFEKSFRKICPYVTMARFSKPGDEFKSAERRFKDRLKLDLTGPLTITITNFKITDCGYYYVQITNKTKKSFKSFTFISSDLLDDDGVEQVSVMQGEPIYLSSMLTDLQEEDQMLCTFGPHGLIIVNSNTSSCSDRFRDRLKLDKTTGSLTINRSTTADDGMYHLQIISSKSVLNQTFNVTVNERIISVKEGESVTLNPETEIQEDDQIQWMFGDQDILIAEIREGTGETHDGDADGRFRDRLKLDKTTGSLTITNSSPADDGMYHLHIISSNRVRNQRFNVTVNDVFDDDAVKKVSVTKGKPIYLNTNMTDLQKEDQMLWTFGPHGLIIADTNTKRCDERFRGRVKLDEKTGSLTITNSSPADDGMYHLQIISSNRVRNQRFNVTVNEDDGKRNRGNTEDDASMSVEMACYDECEDDSNLKTTFLRKKSEDASTSVPM